MEKDVVKPPPAEAKQMPAKDLSSRRQALINRLKQFGERNLLSRDEVASFQQRASNAAEFELRFLETSIRELHSTIHGNGQGTAGQQDVEAAMQAMRQKLSVNAGLLRQIALLYSDSADEKVVAALQEREQELAHRDEQLHAKQEKCSYLAQQLEFEKHSLDQRAQVLEERAALIEQQLAGVSQLKTTLQLRMSDLDQRERALTAREEALPSKEDALQARLKQALLREGELDSKELLLKSREDRLDQEIGQASQRLADLDERESALIEREHHVSEQETRVTRRESEATSREQQLHAQEEALDARTASLEDADRATTYLRITLNSQREDLEKRAEVAARLEHSLREKELAIESRQADTEAGAAANTHRASELARTAAEQEKTKQSQTTLGQQLGEKERELLKLQTQFDAKTAVLAAQSKSLDEQCRHMEKREAEVRRREGELKAEAIVLAEQKAQSTEQWEKRKAEGLQRMQTLAQREAAVKIREEALDALDRRLLQKVPEQFEVRTPGIKGGVLSLKGNTLCWKQPANLSADKKQEFGLEAGDSDFELRIELAAGYRGNLAVLSRLDRCLSSFNSATTSMIDSPLTSPLCREMIQTGHISVLRNARGVGLRAQAVLAPKARVENLILERSEFALSEPNGEDAKTGAIRQLRARDCALRFSLPGLLLDAPVIQGGSLAGDISNGAIVMDARSIIENVDALKANLANVKVIWGANVPEQQQKQLDLKSKIRGLRVHPAAVSDPALRELLNLAPCESKAA